MNPSISASNDIMSSSEEPALDCSTAGFDMEDHVSKYGSQLHSKQIWKDVQELDTLELDEFVTPTC